MSICPHGYPSGTGCYRCEYANAKGPDGLTDAERRAAQVARAAASCDCGPCAAARRIDQLIEQSSLGTPEAKALRATVPDDVARAIVTAARHLERADEAEAALERVRELARVLDEDEGQTSGVKRSVARRICEAIGDQP